MRFLPLVAVLLSAAAAEAGLFSSSECRLYFGSLGERRLGQIIAEGKARGLTAGPQLNQYLERRKRLDYLNYKVEQAEENLKLTVRLFGSYHRLLADSAEPREELWTEAQRQVAGVTKNERAWEYSVKTEMEMRAPKYLNTAKPPSQSEQDEVGALNLSRLSLAKYRLHFSQSLVDGPNNVGLDRDVTKATSPQLDAARNAAEANSIFGSLGSAITPEQGVDAKAHAQRLIDDPQVNKSLKEDLKAHLDFMTKYSQTVDTVFVSLVNGVQRFTYGN